MSTFKQQYRGIKHNIIATHNPLQGVISFFSSGNATAIKKYATALCKEGFFRDAISGMFFPSTISNLGSCSNMPYFPDLDRTLLWYVLGLKIGSTQINDFLELRAKFDHAFLFGKYDTCWTLLDECHQNFGWSIWEIENRITVLSERDGIDAQKQYTRIVLSEMKSGSVLYYLVNSFSKQCERNMSVGTYLNSIRADYNRFLSNNTPACLCKYARYKANGYMLCPLEEIDFLDPITITYFMFEDNQSSLIDRYLSFCNIAADVFTLDTGILSNIFLPYVIDLEREILDPFLRNIIHLQQKQYSCFYPKGNEQICYAFDLYSCGEYQQCIDVTAELLREDVVFFPMIEIYAKSCIYLPDYVPISDARSVLDTVLRKLRQLFTRSGDINEIQTDLIKHLYTHLDAIWSRELLLLIEKYNSRLVVLEDAKLNNFYSAISMPDNIFQFPREHLEDYLSKTSDIYRESVTTQLAIAVRIEDLEHLSNIPMNPIRKKKYEAALLIGDDPQKALKILESIRNLPECWPIKLEIDALRVRANLKQDKLLEAMKIFVPTFFENSNFIYIGDIERIFQSIKSGEHDVDSSILTPIICSLYFNYYPNHDDRDDVILSISYDEYLRSCNVQKPSELLSIIPAGVTDANFIRFLAEVCVPNVMDRSLSFGSYDEVLRERIIICEALIERDPEYREKYTEEIRRLTHSLLVRLAKREVENSKIYVDVEGIRTLLVKEVCEAYERYKEFRENDLNEFSVRILNAMREDSPQITVYVYEDDKQFAMLEDIIKRIRDIFVADNKYGLDGCLSVRIRHGTLESQLRSCFEKHKLVTTKNPDGTYKENTFWHLQKKHSSLGNDRTDSIFASFSCQVDQIITHLKNDLIQIQTEDKNKEGLFDFVINDNLVYYISDKLMDDVSFDQFEDIVLHIMLEYTESSLERVRHVLESEINSAFQQALKELETNLEQHKSIPFNARGLSDQIAMARTDISTELKKISEWFRLTQPGSFSDYPLSLAVTISIETMQYSHSGFTLTCTTSGIDENIYLRGKTLSNIVDIFNILLGNVIQHSGFINTASAKISVQREGQCVFILMENPVKPGTLKPEHLQEVETQLKHWERRGYTNREGGSGLYKIKKILSVDLHCANDISISCTDNTFSIQINAELGEVLL